MSNTAESPKGKKLHLAGCKIAYIAHLEIDRLSDAQCRELLRIAQERNITPNEVLELRVIEKAREAV